ncbi:unnamed protein product, partial [Cladocopium goreaui]
MMVQMLMERRILEEETDRQMRKRLDGGVHEGGCSGLGLGALESFMGGVVAVDNLWLCVAITLGMALVTGLTQPFAQPQMNVLQSACFACLALAAVGFRHHMALARLALAVPFVLLVLQLRRPDSPEMLALRLQQELEAKIHEGPVEVSAEQFTQIFTDETGTFRLAMEKSRGKMSFLALTGCPQTWGIELRFFWRATRCRRGWSALKKCRRSCEGSCRAWVSWEKAIHGIWCYNNCTLRSIRSSDATGGLSSVKEMTDLGVLELAGSQITGNVSELAKLKGLCKLDLSHTEVMGDLAELSKLTALTQLRLPHTQVSGNVAELSKLNLFRLDLSQTEVMGDLAELSKLTALEDLRLPHTQVSGNVAELSKLKELRHLDLSRTQVVGDVSVLTNMTKLYDLSLAQSRVHGDFGVISSMPSLEEADLSSTAVSGNLEDLRWGCCKKLRELHLGDAQVRVSPDVSVRRGLLPALRSFNVSGSKLNASVNDLLAFLASTRITSIVAAGCGLTGELPALLAKTPLGTSLQLLDLSGNGLDAVDALLANLRLDVSRNEIPLRVSRDVIKAAAKSGTDLWMMNTELANREEIMANCSNELQLEQMWTPRETGGYSCHDLVRPNIRVTPERFLPKIMCACGPGHFGAGTNCSACPKNTFNDQMDQNKCQACPQGGKAPAGSQALSACKCPYGTPGTFENKTMCRCDRGEALSSDHECRSCGKLHLVCDAPGSLVATAPLEPGHIRLKEPSEEIFECLDRQHCRNSSCAPGLGR